MESVIWFLIEFSGFWFFNFINNWYGLVLKWVSFNRGVWLIRLSIECGIVIIDFSKN